MFNIRIVTIDHYIGKPIHELYENGDEISKEWQEPVLRIFGATADGFKACVHVHGVYPYIYVPCKGAENPNRDALIVGAALNEALKTTLNPNICRFIYKVTLVSGIPLYGYHSKNRQFFKIYFYNPCHVKKASELLLSGGILGQRFQPHEAHIPFVLQFMMDYNLYGMSFAKFSKVKYRRNPENPDSLVGISEEDFLPSKIKKITCSLFEVDALAGDIMNRIEQTSKGSNPGLRAIWEEERDRRQKQFRKTQITIEQSGPRDNLVMCPTEILYKAQLAQNLKKFSSQEPKEVIPAEPRHSYPAEVPENANFLEASALEENVEPLRVEEHLSDVSVLIDERILTQIAKSQEGEVESEKEAEEEETEADSVLGRNQKTEEEAELEGEEGVDMTQPLDLNEEVICGAESDRDEPGCSRKYNEDKFWKNMADKIFQLDGAQESSSESETEPAPSGTFYNQLELSSTWPGSIMSILSEDSGFPTSSTVCQTPRTFWSNYSPNWLPQNQDSWAWNKNCTSFSDFASKNQNDTLNSSDYSRGSKESVSEEPFNDLFISNVGEYFPLPAVTSHCNVESTISPTSPILTPPSDVDGSDINLGSVSENWPPTLTKEEKFSSENKIIETKITYNRKPETDRQKFLHVLKNFAGRKEPSGENFGQLTLKQYIKDCKEIVSVDFKNLCNKEMIIIEYKSENKRSFQNKYLIKPLDKFLESWDSAERKTTDRVLLNDCSRRKMIDGFNVDEGKNLRSVINVLEKRFSDSSSVQSVSNKLTLKSMELLPDEEEEKGKCYNVNKNVISQGKIKMKLIKSQGGNAEKNLTEEMLSDKCPRSNFKKMASGIEKMEEKEEKGGKNQENDGSFRKNQKVKRTKKRKNLAEPDAKLISEINSSFEEYFKSIVQRKHFNKKKRSLIESKEVEVNEEEWEGKEEEEEELEGGGEENCETSDEEKRNSLSSSKKRCPQDVGASSNAESIKFVTRFLSTFSRMSDMPPLSITISLGRSQTSVPIQVNLQPSAAPSANKIKCFGKFQRRRMKMENVDGPADGSSSENSSSGDPDPRDCTRKKLKRESYYKPLNVVVCGSPSKKKGSRKKKKQSSCGSPLKKGKEERELEMEKNNENKKKEKERTRVKMGRKSFFTNYSEDGFDVCRKDPKPWSLQGENKEKISSQDLVRSESSQRNPGRNSLEVKAWSSREVISSESPELDFIDDSDEGKNPKPSGAWPKVNPEFRVRKIPQADTDAFTSSGEDELNQYDIFMGEKFSKEGENAEGKEVPFGEISDCDRKLVLESVNENVGFGGNVEGEEPKGLSQAKGASNQISPRDINSADFDYFSRDLEKSGSRTSLIPSDGFSKSLSSQRTFSPFTLSGSPLLSSNRVPLGLESSEGTEGNLFTANVYKSSELSARQKPCFLKECFESSEWNDEETDVEAISLDWITGHRIIRPKKRTLSRKDIFKSVPCDRIFESVDNAPFYSNPRDVAKAIETGPRVLKVENRSVAGLKLFKSSLDINGIEEIRKQVLKSLKIERCCLVRDIDASITPTLKPPTPKTVSKGSFTGHLESNHRNQVKSKRVMVKPLSPGEEVGSDDETELSFTVSGVSGNCGSDDLAHQENFLQIHSLPSKTSDIFDLESNLKKRPKGIKRFCLATKSGPQEASIIAPRSRSLSKSPISSSTVGSKRNSENSFQIRGITLDNSFGFRHSVENMQNVKLFEKHQYMSILVMELHVQTRKNLRPDPSHDPIRALFYAIAFDDPARNQERGILVVGDRFLSGAGVSGLTIHYVPTEKELIEKLLGLMRVWDPEILAGYEIEMHSWGYLVQRGFILNMNLLLLLGRVLAEDINNKKNWNFNSISDDADDIPKSVKHMQISGRIVLDMWRILRHEVALTSYTFENVMYHLSHERHPLLSHESLSRYWEHPSHKFQHIVIEHYTTRVFGVMRILDQLDFINRTSELSRLFGIQFYEVLSRGSQFRVESMMLRLAKPLNYVAASPSVAQRAAMRAPASLPLILEPESLFYSDPIIVLDFQSLYPSLIIAYNYCFSTCLGRVEKLGGHEPFEFGCTQLKIAPEELKRLESDLSVSPAGVAFVRPSVRKGVLPTMLEEILETRMMVKKSMKESKGNKTMEKVLYTRQLGLKLIANVTYGYTAANFSGRMPCIEVGDSVVSKGRETLHRAIQLVKGTQKWGAKVVYGDTDSIFVCTPGKSRDEAFKIGAEIAEAVTQDNPKPVKLKLEKVYQPSILQTKKRYVGYMFESPGQEKPVFESKGIETVRRDGCLATRKILEKALQILFDTRDLSLVKKYTIRQFAKLFQGSVNVQDLIFAKEYRGRKGYRPGACVPALHLAKEWTQYDKRAEPRVKERVPYVIVNGPPGVPLIRLVRSPADLISDPSLRINAAYYITKALIPPMQRCFSLLGADVTSWFIEMPRKYHKMYKWNCFEGRKRNTISQYFTTTDCFVCSEVTNSLVCSNCEKHPQALVVQLNEEIRRWERCHESLLEICRSCCERASELACISLDCPILYRRNQAARALSQNPVLREVLNRYA